MKTTMVQIRNVPEDLQRRIKARAAMSGMSMSDFILRVLRKAMDRPTRDELLERMARMEPVELEPDPRTLIRQERDSQ